VATALLGGLAGATRSSTRHPHRDRPRWTAVALFVALILLSLLVITPRRSWVFFHHPHRLIAVYLAAASPWSLAEYRRAVAHHNGSYVDVNARQLRFFFRALAPR
jgi:hypothetical protein